MCQLMIVYTDRDHEPFQIDADDYDAVSRYTWHINDGGYAASHTGKWPETKKIQLHQFLMGKAPKGLEWDHKNRDKRDNRRENLRLVRRQINVRNRGVNARNTSGYRGVRRDKRLTRRPWMASIIIARKETILGYYETPEAAWEARQKAEDSLWAER